MSQSTTRSANRSDDTDPGREIDHPLFAVLYDLLPQSLVVAPHREYLARDLSGRVLELGCGTGDQFPYVAASAADDLEYHAIEPDPNMRKRAISAAHDAGLAVDLRDARAESLPYPDDAFDAVVSGAVFCTVQDPAAALAEVARVLKPGGEFRFLEHVRADGWRARGQDLLTPLWERVAGGCHLNRNTVDRFVAHDAFAVEDAERIGLGVFPVRPVVRGRLRRRREGVVDLSDLAPAVGT
ncbi:class I SAM-dependent methyltransferase [Halopiger goleimassiliensis]|uniref:class I SAM-dependent methyltransferase n=1 Tax=Halopiger goleimassiliensis TaxID=1293048 RepID=UPI000677A45A|nr:class I SAM-dependent methyltransferase [Halopiger goleimassiliensis]